MNYVKFFTAVLFIYIWFSSCKPEPKKTPIYFNTEFKNYFNYQLGSYWIFYDSLNLRTDSLSVISNTYFPPFYGGIPNEIINIDMFFYNSGDSAIALQFQLSAKYALGLFFAYIHQSSGVKNQYPTDLVTDIPFNITGKVSISVGDFIGYCDRSFVGNLKINGITYSNVYRIEYNNTHLSTIDIFYFNRDQGFLEILFHNQYANRKLYLTHSHVIK